MCERCDRVVVPKVGWALACIRCPQLCAEGVCRGRKGTWERLLAHASKSAWSPPALGQPDCRPRALLKVNIESTTPCFFACCTQFDRSVLAMMETRITAKATFKVGLD